MSSGNEDDGKEDKNPSNAERPSHSRWWEQYTVRYFVGTVAGVVAIYALREYAHLSTDFANVIPELGDAGNAVLLGSMGLAYCYVASAPILTLHAVRSVFRLNEEAHCQRVARLSGLALLTLAFGVWGISRWISCAAISWLVAAIVVTPQMWLVFLSSRNGFRSTHEFYKKLVKARKEEWLRQEDFVDSYRHLREHGNAKSILALEIVLGVMIANAESPAQLLVLLLLWMFPSAYCWLIGSVLESRFAHGK